MRNIALLALGFAGIWAFEGCASDSNSGYHSSKPDGGSCNVAFCPAPTNGGVQCCINGGCGIDLGTGCIQLAHRDGF